MCGILAVLFNPISSISRRYLIHQLHKIYWRGPDSTIDLNVTNQVYMGFTRLAINDLSQLGNQPMQIGPISIVCNGEIYNFKKLKE